MEATAKKLTTITRKSAFDFEALKKKVVDEHWRKFALVIKLRDRLHAGKPAQLDAAKAMLAARGLEEVVEAREAARPVDERVEEVVEEGLCEFHRRPDKAGLWWPANNFKACIKENWSVLGYRMDATPRSKRKGEDVDTTMSVAMEEAGLEGDKKKGKRKALQGSRAAIAEGVFVVSTVEDDLDWIYLGEKADGIDTQVAHTMGPKGPQSSIKRNEYVLRPTLEFQLWVAKAIMDKIPDESLVDTLVHAQEHGIGANRSQGMGRFDIVSMNEID